ncbi:hypothetical protein KO525_11590 [Psychrosphaera sp. B3R10]|uniref:hypothetical protein n=1 Tax=unclassified Psychrosphaera TaxID=2641570 RepID=UPI001C0A1D6B|nr:MULTISPECIES: hypothetical protein [unclassified Psychrosphaera]MBU2881097.1 hypothetical protein [Psychrosphaera sp. I2R16]MBU2990021.1 hypothetical protein [Psychrosphaera sp. B3R10]
MRLFNDIKSDKNLYAISALPLVTVYDDNWFLRNDYDVLSIGQRNYIIQFFAQYGFKQKTGKTLKQLDKTVHLVQPNRNLAMSNFDPRFIETPPQTSSAEGLNVDALNRDNVFVITPTMFAEALFYCHVEDKALAIESVKQLINTCPYNIEWLRDIAYRTPIEAVTNDSYNALVAYQKHVIANKFKKKKAL